MENLEQKLKEYNERLDKIESEYAEKMNKVDINKVSFPETETDKEKSGREFKEFLLNTKTITSTTDPATVPNQYASNILQTMGNYGVAMKYGTIFNLNSTTMIIPTTTAVPTANWLSQGASVTASQPATQSKSIAMKRLQVKVPITNEMLKASGYDLQAWVTKEVALQMSKAIDVQALGTGTDFTGAYGGTAYTQSATGLATAATWTDIVGLKAAVDPVFWSNSRFVFDPTHWSTVYGLKDTTGRPLFDGQVGTNLFAGSPYEVVSTGVFNAASVTASGTKMWIYGDLSNIWVGTGSGIEVLVDPYVSAAEGITNFYFTMYTGVGITRTNSIAYHKIQ